MVQHTSGRESIGLIFYSNHMYLEKRKAPHRPTHIPPKRKKKVIFAVRLNATTPIFNIASNVCLSSECLLNTSLILAGERHTNSVEALNTVKIDRRLTFITQLNAKATGANTNSRPVRQKLVQQNRLQAKHVELYSDLFHE